MAHRELISINSAAERRDCSPRTIRRLIADGKLNGYRVSKRLLRVDAAELDAMLREIPTAGNL